jgi:deoxycytidylate deaminase
MAFKHGCIILDNKFNIISYGFNLQPTYFNWNQSIHAEACAINKLKYDKKHLLNIHKYYLIVVRLSNIYKDNNGNINIVYGNSKPCNNCQKIINKIGFKETNIIYSLPKE